MQNKQKIKRGRYSHIWSERQIDERTNKNGNELTLSKYEVLKNANVASIQIERAKNVFISIYSVRNFVHILVSDESLVDYFTGSLIIYRR